MQPKTLSHCLVCIVLFSCSAIPVRSAENMPVPPDIQSVALFKNGLGYFTTSVSLEEGRQGKLTVSPFLAASHGTFWIHYPAGFTLRNIAAREIETEFEQPATSIPQLLSANVGQRVQLTVSGNTVSGVLRKVFFGEPPIVVNPYEAGSAFSDHQNRNYGYSQQGTVLVESSDGLHAVHLNQIQQAQFRGDNVNYTFQDERDAAELSMALGEGNPKGALSIQYLAKGITWAPSYRVDIDGEREARLSAKAVIVNDIVDLNNVRIELVTGFPHLKFADVLSPLALKETLSQFLSALENLQSRQQNQQRGVMAQSAMANYGGGFGGGGFATAPVPEYGAATAGQEAEDLFLYPVENVTLARQERAYLPLFTQTVPIDHLYRWDIPDYIDEQERYGRQQEESDMQVVWHTLELENTTDVPWTTAPAQTVKNGQIIGQDMLAYTPVEGKQTLRITQAVGLKAEQAEFELERERGVTRNYGYSYDKVKLEGQLVITSYKSQTVKLKITKTLSGEVLSHNPEAEVRKLGTGLQKMNPTNKLSWTTDIDPGETKELQYTYEVLIRN